ncbi:MAG: 5'/3'-nucleotidase SurE [Bacteroidota bacterium]
MAKPLILVTNDDGITAKGIASLVKVAGEIGEVIVVAPDSPQSAQGHALSLETPVFVHESDIFPDHEAYACSGTPVDCVKLAKSILLKGRTPDLCVSGINHGSNVAINILYSGTLSAAMEASIEHIPSIGFSLLDFHPDADFSAAEEVARQLILDVLENGMAEGSLYNVNIPKLPLAAIKGIKVCRQAEARWIEEYVAAKDPRGRTYYWLTGKFVNEDDRPDTDVKALEDSYVSLVPSMHNLTNEAALPRLQERAPQWQLPKKASAGPSAHNSDQKMEQF